MSESEHGYIYISKQEHINACTKRWHVLLAHNHNVWWPRAIIIYDVRVWSSYVVIMDGHHPWLAYIYILYIYICIHIYMHIYTHMITVCQDTLQSYTIDLYNQCRSQQPKINTCDHWAWRWHMLMRDCNILWLSRMIIIRDHHAQSSQMMINNLCLCLFVWNTVCSALKRCTQ